MGELAVYEGGFSVDALPGLGEVMDVCLEKDAPLLLHTNEPVGHAYPGKTPMRLADLYTFLKAFPRNRIILAHWGGGLFFYGLMKKEVRDVLKNVWFDTAASPFLYTPQVYRIAAEIAGADRILFGSDYPLIRPKRYLDEMRDSGLPREDMDRIVGGNAAALFGLEGDGGA